ncbi:hypothetical protein RMCBS344292_01353 [Rhizopus microsporus]|nr:hypothetical protein RMCBS344292_01353 [Rhizopus microsporus]
MDGLFDKFGRPKTKSRSAQSTPSPKSRSVKRMLSIKPKASELNLALTGVITALALCPYRSLEGWIAFSESDQTSPDDVLILNPNGQATASQPKIRSQDIYAHFETTAPVDEDDEEDDRSIDFGAERESAKVTRPTFFKSYPPFFTLLRTLTQQIDYYRSEIPGFDALLEERRNALITGEVSFIDRKLMSPSSSTTTNVSRSNHVPTQVNRRPSVLRPTSTETPALSPSSSSSTMVGSRLGHGSQINMTAVMNNPMSPLALHIRKTTSIRIQPLFPSHFKRHDKSTEITLSMLLNNVVILEESIKELVALMQVRRSLGIDEVAYV